MTGVGELTITTGLNSGGDSVFAAIRDTGYGIPEEHLGKIFDPFFTTKDQKGQGWASGFRRHHRQSRRPDRSGECGGPRERPLRSLCRCRERMKISRGSAGIESMYRAHSFPANSPDLGSD